MRMWAVFVLIVAARAAMVLKDWNDLEWNIDNRLESNWLLYNSICPVNVDVVASLEAALMDDSISATFSNISTKACISVCLQRGSHRHSFMHVLPQQLYVVTPELFDTTVFQQWLVDCQRAEFGIISYHPNPLEVYFLNDEDVAYHVGTVGFGERRTVWIQTFLSHRFRIIDSHTNEVLQEVTIFNSMFLRFGEHPVAADSEAKIDIDDIKLTLYNEVARSHRIKRTFTRSGFSKGKLPPDLWASIDTYYYNNKNAFGTLEWAGKGYYVNWWEVPVQLLGIPQQLKRYWQSRLKDLVEAWVGGIPLENTDIYGIRRYLDGARLLTHVDREATHAVSVIVNIAQGEMREPWQLEIYDFEGRLHKITMEAGDISARCLHGRMKPLQGSFYDNLFSHYRPVGDPEWYHRERTVNFLSDFDTETCSSRHDGSDVVKSGEDLFTFWRKMTPVGGFGEEFRL